ncbi:lipoprotein [Actinoplanes sp. LDG1-06]|uniref:Lipoprotein n=1 Tax=Paractinoplanes ovalisporus TaxID=2810368 RepID=A0ABS2ARB3_9ACTN|nr:lipoprotein [Actinoplanes ovalisporus]MBM2622407.1 lipoprotein [Actinoplanes ovalisporus]
MRRIVPLLVAVAMLTGCASARSAAAPAAPSTPPVTPVAAAPVLANTGDDWPAVVGSLIAYGQWLLSAPDPALASKVTTPGCAGAESLTEELASLVDQDARVRTSAVVLTSITGPSSPAGDRVVVRFQASRPAEPVVVRSHSGLSPSARTIWLEDRPQLAPTTFRVTLTRNDDQAWRFCTVTDTAGDPESEAITRLL